MKKIILFFTNSSKLRKLFRNNDKITITKNDLIKISIDNCNDCEVYVLNDNTIADIITKTQSNDYEGYCIYHNDTNPNLINTLKKNNFNVLKDHHEIIISPFTKGYYLWLATKVPREKSDEVYSKFVSEIEKDLFDEIWDKFEQTNQTDESLDLLHDLQNEKIVNPNNLSEDLKKQFITHYNLTEKYTNIHESKLVNLRDAILKTKLANQN
jgi:hypothetical protein